ncbi:helix-turn-helix domain-containing protein [Thiotrichales bacterium 19S3-7]|nr:helix-turn-helix domain-containing protein [Thiotrichales bacterium 19S3-7]MCF6802226.1 helix-turn-helix domain-containing protein [Thiotrichales bacterium 19S3-11]
MNFLGITIGRSNKKELDVDNRIDMVTFGGRLSYLISLKKTTQTAIAKSIGVSPQTIQHLCKSKTSKTRYLTEIAMALDVNPIWLSTGNGLMISNSGSYYDIDVPLLNFNDVNQNLFLNEKINSTENINLSVSNNDKDKYSFAILVSKNDKISNLFPLGTLLIFEIKDKYDDDGYYLIEIENNCSIEQLIYNDKSFYFNQNYSRKLYKNSCILAQLLESRFTYQKK